MSTEVKRQRTNKDPYVMTDEKLIHYINMMVPIPFSEKFERVQKMTREELMKEWLKYYDTPALAPVEVR